MDLYGTLGASCARREILTAMFQAGMTGARLNLSHTTLPECASLLEEEFWPAARQAGVEASLIVDLQGPELRVGRLEEPVSLREGGSALLGAGGIPVPRSVVEAARPGDQISLDDSALLLTVREANPDCLTCRVERGGLLKSRKSLALLGREVDSPTLTAEDRANLAQAGRFGVTHILQPFVRGREDLLTLRSALAELGLDQVKIMAKIENRRGMEKLDEILEEADVICIARGDLGNSMPLWELPSAQKRIARTCRAAGKPFFVVTQLLWSMEERAVPTRAEVSDIYNAVLDGSCALMLTGETAAGRHPLKAMEYLAKTARCALRDLNPDVSLFPPPKGLKPKQKHRNWEIPYNGERETDFICQRLHAGAGALPHLEAVPDLFECLQKPLAGGGDPGAGSDRLPPAGAHHRAGRPAAPALP